MSHGRCQADLGSYYHDGEEAGTGGNWLRKSHVACSPFFHPSIERVSGSMRYPYSAFCMSIKHRFRSPSCLLRSHDARAHGLSIRQRMSFADVATVSSLPPASFDFIY